MWYKFVVRALCFVLIGASACTIPDEEAPFVNESLYETNFMNHELQGRIQGKSFKSSAHIAELQFGNRVFTVIDTFRGDSCTIFPVENSAFAIWSIPESDIRVGRFNLSLNPNTLDGFTVNITYNSSTLQNNTVSASLGAVEILAIDSLNNELRCQMDVFFDEFNYLNGRFAVKLCN